MNADLYQHFGGLKNYLFREDGEMEEIKMVLPRYYEAIRMEIAKSEESYRKGDKLGVNAHIRKAMGYCKKARSLMKGGKN